MQENIENNTESINTLDTRMGGIKIVVKAYGDTTIKTGDQTFLYPSDITSSKVLTVFARYGELLLPFPNTDKSGKTDNSYSLAVFTGSGEFHIVATSNWSKRQLYAVFLVQN